MEAKAVSRKSSVMTIAYGGAGLDPLKLALLVP
jgi:hypothetical protein